MVWRAPSTLRRGSPSAAATANVRRGSRLPGRTWKMGGFGVFLGGLVFSGGVLGVSQVLWRLLVAIGVLSWFFEIFQGVLESSCGVVLVSWWFLRSSCGFMGFSHAFLVSPRVFLGCPHDFLGILGIFLGVLELSPVLGGFSCGFLRFSHVFVGSSHGFFGSSLCLMGSSHGFWGLLMVLCGIPVFLGPSH